MDEIFVVNPFPAMVLLILIAPVSLSAEDMFEVSTFSSNGRSVAAEIAELNGDGRPDFFVVALEGIPPEEKRTIRVYLQTAEGSFPTRPNHQLAVPAGSAVYDVADVVPQSPGEELVFLQSDGVTLLSLADSSGQSWKLPVPGPATIGLAEDERGLEQFKLVYREFGAEPWILVPQLGLLTALTGAG
ncbi:MAG: FG-GAP repeat domain-containing protein, partial [Pseudomonadales bacterium]